MTGNHFNVIVVGAGPGGSTAALCIARRGYRVLLIDKYKFPRDKSCGDGLTRMSAKILYDLDLWKDLDEFQKIRGVKVFVEAEGFQEFIYPEDLEEPSHGLVIPRFILDNIICKKATESGVELLEKTSFKNLIYDKDNTVIGIKLTTGAEFFSDIVIGADGAASKIAYEANLASTPKTKLGFGIRGYFSGASEMKENLEIYLPILDSSDKYVLPSYGWMFPLANNLINIGVGLTTKQESDNVNSIMEMFVQKLRSSDDRFKNIKMEGKYMGAPMRFDFTPHKSYSPGLLLVGDAAGMISPFTGEGIGYAMETGKIAADLYIKLAKTNDKQNFKDLSSYGKVLSNKYQGYFETGIQSVNRYHLVWKVLKNTFQNEKQLFKTLRQATLFPEGIGESFFNHLTVDVSTCFKSNEQTIKTDIIAITQNLINITRKDWPFFSRLFTASQATPGIPLNPTLLIFLAGNLFNPDRKELIKLGTALELGYAAILCHNSVCEDKKGEKSVNWGNMLSVLLGDFLLSKSYEMTAYLDNNANLISKAMGLSSEGYFKMNRIIENNADITVDEYLDLVYLKNSSLFELCTYLGSINSKGSISESESLKQFGRYFGSAFQIVEEIKMISKKGKASKINNIYMNLVSDTLNLPQIFMKQSKTPNGKNTDQLYVDRAMEIAKNEIVKAKKSLIAIKNDVNKGILIDIADFMINQGKAFIN